MIVVFDTNAVMQDPMCGGAVWQVLAHAPQSWSLQLMTSEVAVAEAVAGYSRAVAEAVAAFDKVARSWGRIGAQVQADSARDELQKKVHVYRDHLTESLREVGVAVLPPPDVSHMEVVARSVSRTRPCDDIGNGYRDTLIWLTVLQIASERSDEPVIFVTNDSDFMNSDRSGFHEDLVADLSSIGAEDRVGLRQALADVVIQLAEQSPDEEDVKALRAELRDETVRQYVTSLLDEVIGNPLDLRACALPPTAANGSLERLGEISDFSYNIRGEVGSGQVVAEFSIEAQTDVTVTMPAGVNPDDELAKAVVQSQDRTVYLISKPLMFTGLLRLGRYDRPLGGEITRMSSRADDPGRSAWRKASLSPLLSDVVKNMYFNPMGDVLKNMGFNPMGDVLKNMGFNPMGDVLKNMDFNPLRDVIKNMELNPMRDLLATLEIYQTAANRDANAHQPPASEPGDGGPGGAQPDADDDKDGEDPA